jgi:hypothetical protein
VLRAAFEHEPDETSKWALRVLIALKSVLPGSPLDRLAQMFLVVAWKPWDREDDAFIRRLIKILRELNGVVGRLSRSWCVQRPHFDSRR